MSIGVLGEYAKSIFASSPCTQRFFPRILRVDTFSAYGEVFRRTYGELYLGQRKRRAMQDQVGAK